MLCVVDDRPQCNIDINSGILITSIRPLALSLEYHAGRIITVSLRTLTGYEQVLKGTGDSKSLTFNTSHLQLECETLSQSRGCDGSLRQCIMRQPACNVPPSSKIRFK